jgi:hypothetical protein
VLDMTQPSTCALNWLLSAIAALWIVVPGSALAQDEEDPVAQEAPSDQGPNPEEAIYVDMRGPIGGQVAGGVSVDEIRWHLNRQRRSIQQCFAERIFNPQVLSGRIVVTFVISPAGVVTGASVSSSTIDDSQIEQCVVQSIRRATFPRTTDLLPLVVSYPVISREYLPTWTQPVIFASPDRWEAAEPDSQ